MKKPLIIFGAGKIAEAVTYFFERDSEYEISAYIEDDVYVSKEQYMNKPLLKLSEVETKFPKTEYAVFVAVGYQGINSFRTQKYLYFKQLGYSFANYISPFVKGNFTIGENSIIMDYAMIQPCVSIANNCFVWGGAMIGHHAKIEDNVWLTGGCMVGGVTQIGQSSFIGLGAVVGHEVAIGEQCMIGASALIIKNLENKAVVIASPTEKHRLNSQQFTRMSSCFRT